MAAIQLPEKLQPLFKAARYKIAYGGRGGTKSWGFARALLLQGTTKPLRILCAREVQRSIKDSVHKLLKDQIQALNLGLFYTVLETEIRGINGTEFLFVGLSNLTVESIKSYEGVDICWVEEGQSVIKRSWSILIPTIRKAGSEIWVSFNPDLDTDDTYVRFVENTPPNSVVININYADNPWPTKELDQERDHCKAVDPEEYDNVWLGKCRSSVAGAIYRREVAALRVQNVPHDPSLRVHCVWDLGFNDQTAIILVQRTATEVRIIDYMEDSYKNMGEWVVELSRKPYNYGTDWLPWDGSEEKYRLTDPKTSPEGILKALRRRVQVLDQVDVEIGIKRARMVFPRCYFDREATIRLRECLKRYCRNIPLTTNEPAKPKHDQYSHGADAFRYLAMCVDQMKNDERPFAKKIQYDSRGVV